MDGPSRRQIARTALGAFAVVVGLLCLAGAVVFGLTAEVPNMAAAGAAGGLAVAGGLCFVAAALAEAGARQRPPGEGGTGPT